MAIPVLTLNDSREIPAIGLGTYNLRGEPGVASLVGAIDAGYRLLDTAFNYDNEAAVGRAVAKSDVPREELFVTSKLPGRYHGFELATHAIRESIWRLGLTYLDLYLIHWPNPSQGKFVEAWRALIDAQKMGLVRSIGVSNFTPDHLATLQSETGVLPAVNQIELHPYFPQEQQLAVHEELGIVTQAWSPIGRGRELIEEPVIREIAAAYGVSPAQAVIRWHVQRGSLPIPKSANRERQAANLDVFGFVLTDDEIAAITALGRPDGRLFDADPNHHEEM